MRGSTEFEARHLVTQIRTFALLWLARLRASLIARGGNGEDKRMVLLEALHLGNRRQLFLVMCDGQRFLVGASAERVGTLVAVTEPALDSAPAQPENVRQGLGRSAFSHRQSAPRIHSADIGIEPALQLVERRLKANAAATVVLGSNSKRQQSSETGDSRWR
jgi:flagellar biogenesis protein FliO